MSTFRVETLLASLKEIQQEKSCLEQKLNERRYRRRQLEEELETVNGKFIQVKDVHTKMNETLRVAQHKVAQTQSLANSLDENNQTYKKNITDLNKRVEDEKKTQNDEVTGFEDNLAVISNQMVSARKIYSDENLENELTEADKMEEELNQKAKEHSFYMSEMETDFDKLRVNPQEEPCYADIPIELRKELCIRRSAQVAETSIHDVLLLSISTKSFFQDEHQKATECLNDIQRQVNNAKDMMETIRNSN